MNTRRVDIVRLIIFEILEYHTLCLYHVEL